MGTNMKLLIAYKNETSDEFSEKNLDCSKRTIRGHASNIISAWKSLAGNPVYSIDDYNAVLLDEVISIRVME